MDCTELELHWECIDDNVVSGVYIVLISIPMLVMTIILMEMTMISKDW